MTALLIRNYTPADAEALTTLVNACVQADHVGNHTSAKALLAIAGGNVDPERYYFVAQVGRHSVGFSSVYRDVGTRVSLRFWVHPSQRNTDIGRRLVLHNETVLRQFPEALLDIPVHPTEAFKLALVQELGYHNERSWWRMRLELPEHMPSAVILPPGFQVRPFVPGKDEQTLTTVMNGVFHDHWGEGQHALEEIQQEVSWPWFDPSLLLFLETNSQAVGYVWSWINQECISASGDTCGEISDLGLVPDYRGHGLGRALLWRALTDLKARGILAVELDMDGLNVRAKHLYESVGFYAKEETCWYRKNLRA